MRRRWPVLVALLASAAVAPAAAAHAGGDGVRQPDGIAE